MLLKYSLTTRPEIRVDTTSKYSSTVEEILGNKTSVSSIISLVYLIGNSGMSQIKDQRYTILDWKPLKVCFEFSRNSREMATYIFSNCSKLKIAYYSNCASLNFFRISLTYRIWDTIVTNSFLSRHSRTLHSMFRLEEKKWFCHLKITLTVPTLVRFAISTFKVNHSTYEVLYVRILKVFFICAHSFIYIYTENLAKSGDPNREIWLWIFLGFQIFSRLFLLYSARELPLVKISIFNPYLDSK